MSACPVCDSVVPEESRFCGRCGSSVDSASSTPTQTSVPVTPSSGTAPGRASRAGRLGSSDGLEESRFLPGTMLQRRYRIVGLIGRGGMGEVYRADDLKLAQPVALKFLPEQLERDEGRLTRFLNEVRVARQVSHANVCRVYDVGEVEPPAPVAGQDPTGSEPAGGQHYISMEYVDGEDLASLLRRIGRLPHDKAVEIARQICAGLAAAHARGIAHRDLKPANVMIDGRGQVRITDFGLAGLAEGIHGAEIRAGTPDYMAPEQLAGKEVTLRSDLYALGLVLYELFTGERAYRAESMADLLRLREQTPPASPSTLVDGLDPLVERVILRCLEKDPQNRPGSALAVAAALPGADPLAAALAAGETPSPEMVAGAGSEGGLRPWIAVLLLVAAFSAVAGVVLMAQEQRLIHKVPLTRPPAALADEARQILARLGHDAPPVDRVHGFYADRNYLNHVRQADQTAGRWEALSSVRPSPVRFWYRESPRPLLPYGASGAVSQINPPLQISGMNRVSLDAEGRLTGLIVVPPERDEPAAAMDEPDWSILFEAAGLELADFDAASPAWNPLVDCDLRAAWEGTYPGQPEIPIRVEAGSYRGRPIYFRVAAPWTEPSRMGPRDGGRTGVRVAEMILLSAFVLVLVGGVVLARRNVRFGRLDRRGAFRIALYLFTITLVTWAIATHHVAALGEVSRFFYAIQWALLVAAVSWVVYVALEPYARRLWPHVLISWTRLLSGRLRDPLVGRDILIGYLVGAGLACLALLSRIVPQWLGRPPVEPVSNAIEVIGGIRQTIALFFSIQLGATFVPLAVLFLIVLLRMLLRNPWVAVGGAWIVMTAIGGLGRDGTPLDWLFAAVLYAVVLAVLLRVGLLSTILGFFFADLILHLPLAFGPAAWFAPWSTGVLALASVLGIYGFYISMAGRPLFEDVLARG